MAVEQHHCTAAVGQRGSVYLHARRARGQLLGGLCRSLRSSCTTPQPTTAQATTDTARPTSLGPCFQMRSPGTPSSSWLMAITSLDLSSARLAGGMRRRSAAMNSGDLSTALQEGGVQRRVEEAVVGRLACLLGKISCLCERP